MPQPPPVRVGGRDNVEIYSLSKSKYTLTNCDRPRLIVSADGRIRKNAKSAGMCVIEQSITRESNDF